MATPFQPRFTDLVTMTRASFTQYAHRPHFGTKRNGAWHWVTYGEVGRMVDAFRAALAGMGVGKGDRVAVISNNRVEWAVGAWATYGLGACYVPMYEAQLDKEWKYILADSEAKVCLAANDGIYDRVSALRQELPKLERVVNFEGTAPDSTSYRQLLDQGAKAPVAEHKPAPGDIAGYIYTSGTTGNPKGVLLTHANLASNVSAILDRIPFTPDDRSLAFLPWAHSYGQTVELHGMTLMGCSIGICEGVDKIIPNLAEVRPTILFAVPRIFNRIHDGVQKNVKSKPAPIQALFRAGMRAAAKQRNGEPLALTERLALAGAKKLIFGKIIEKFGGRLKYALSGSAALSKDVAEFVDNLGIVVYEGYGLTETSPLATANFPGSRKIGSIGKPIPGVEVKIDTSVSDEPGQGEIIVYGHCVMKGYHNLPAETAAVLMPDGGFRTGDLGRVDSDGFVYITGRVKELYKLETGKYVAPAPLEEKITLSPYIAQIMIHGANKPYNVAVVVPDMAAITEWAKAQGIDATPERLLQNEKLRALVQAEIDKHSTDFKSYDRVKKFVLTAEEFTTANDMLTQTLKLKRRNAAKKYEAQLEALYAEPQRAAG